MRTKCRLCDSTDLELAVKVPPMPMIDGYTQAPNQFKAMPCDVYFCHSCGHAQLLDVLPPADIFTKYIFRTGDSPNLVSHFRAYADWLIANFDTSFVYEIGCNDGTLLEMMPNKKLGIDPSNIPCSTPSVRTFLTETTAKEIYKEHGPAPLIVANHVFAHADDLVDMLRGIRFLMTNRGKFIFEVAYAQDMLDKCLFDQIEHEHLSYHSIKPLIRFFSRYGMEITEIHRNDCKGGSVRCVAELSMEGYIPKFTEDCSIERYREFAQKIHQKREALSGLNQVIGYGAAAPCTSVMYQMDLQDRITFLVDDNERRQGLYSPGLNIPIRPTSALADSDLPIVILAPRYADAIIKNNPRYAERFINV